MIDDVIHSLKRYGGNIRRLMPELELIDDSQRFDSRRFDILACHYKESKIYGIKDLGRDHGAEGLQTTLKDAEWIRRYNGAVIILIPAEDASLRDVFDDEVSKGTILRKYYSSDGQGYVFMDDPAQYQISYEARFQEEASRFLTNPQFIDFILKQFEKELPAIRFAREIYKAYIKAQK